MSNGKKSNNIDVTPIPWTKEVLGIYKADLDKIGAKDGDWVKVKYAKSKKEIDIKVRERDHNPGWPDQVVWMSSDKRKKLELPPKISQCDESNLPKESDGELVKISLWRYTIPIRGNDLYRISFAMLTLIFTIAAVLLNGWSSLLKEGDQLALPIGIGIASIAIVGAVGTFIASIRKDE